MDSMTRSTLQVRGDFSGEGGRPFLAGEAMDSVTRSVLQVRSQGGVMGIGQNDRCACMQVGIQPPLYRYLGTPMPSLPGTTFCGQAHFQLCSNAPSFIFSSLPPCPHRQVLVGAYMTTSQLPFGPGEKAEELATETTIMPTMPLPSSATTTPPMPLLEKTMPPGMPLLPST